MLLHNLRLKRRLCDLAPLMAGDIIAGREEANKIFYFGIRRQPVADVSPDPDDIAFSALAGSVAQVHTVTKKTRRCPRSHHVSGIIEQLTTIGSTI